MRYRPLLLILFFAFLATSIYGQNVNVKLDILGQWFNTGGDGLGNKPDPTWKVTAIMASAGVSGSACIHKSGVNHGSFSETAEVFNSTVPNLFFPLHGIIPITVHLEAWEDDRGSSCSYDCCGTFTNDDDAHATGLIADILVNWVENQGDTYDFTLATSNGKYSVDLRLTLTVLDSYVDDALAITSAVSPFDPQSAFCVGDEMRVYSSITPGFTPYSLYWEKKVNGNWQFHTITHNVDFLQVTVTDPFTHYRAKPYVSDMLDGMAEVAGFRSTEAQSVTVYPRAPYASEISIDYDDFCVGTTTSVYVTFDSSIPVGNEYDLALSGSQTFTLNNVVNTGGAIEFTNVPADTYELAVTSDNASDCTNFVPGVVVSATPIPIITSVETTAPICDGYSNGTILVFIDGQGVSGGKTVELTGTVSETRVIGGSAVQFSNLPEGTYGISVSNNIGCTASTHADDPWSLNAPDPLTLTIQLPQDGLTTNIDCFENAGTAIVTPSGGTPPYRIRDDQGSTFISNIQGSVAVPFTVVAGSNQTFRVWDDNNCFGSSTVSITQPSQLTISVVDTTTATGCDNSGEVFLSASGGEGSHQFAVDDGAFGASSTITGLAGGSHIAKVMDDNGCISTISFQIDQPAALQASATITDVTCFGGADGALTINGSGGNPGYEYAFEGGAFGATNIFTGLVAGTYTIQVRDMDSCISTSEVTVDEPSEIIIKTVDASLPSCPGDEGGLTITFFFGGVFGFSDGAGEISFDGGTTYQSLEYFYVDDFQFIQYSGLSGQASPLNISLRTSDGCVSANTFEVVLDDPAPIVISGISSTAETCPGNNDGEISFSVTGGRSPYNIDLYNNGAIVASSGPVDSQTGTVNYTFTGLTPATATTGDGLSGYAIVVQDSSMSKGAPADCSATFPDTFSPPNFVGASETNISVAAATNPSISSIVNTGPLLNCFNGGGGNNGEVTVTVVDGTAPYEYSKDGNIYQTSNVLTGLTLANTIYVRDANGCTTSQNYTFSDSDRVPILSATGVVTANATSCTQGSIEITISDGTGPFQVEVYPNADVTCDEVINTSGFPIHAFTTSSTTFTVDNLDGGTYGFSFYDETTGCFNCLNDIEVTETAEPVITVTGTTDESCDPGSDGSISVSVTGGTAPYTVENNFTDPQVGSTVTYTGLTAGNYALRVTDANGCTDIVQGSVGSVEPLEIVYTAVDADCPSAATGSLTVEVINGTPPYTLVWDFDQSSETLGSGETTSRSNLTAQEYEFTITDANGCTNIATAIVEQPDSVVLSSIDITEASCDGASDGEATVNVSGGTSIFEFALDGATFQASNTFTGLAAGDFTVTVRDGGICTTEFDFTMTVGGNITATSLVTDVSCNGLSDGSLSVTPTGGTEPYSYSIDGSTFQSDPTFTGLAASSYDVIIQDAIGCTTVETGLIIDEPTLLDGSVTVVQDATCTEATGTLEATGIGGTSPYSYIWDSDPLLTGNTLSDATAGDHTVEITDANGCTFSTIGTISTIASVDLQLDELIDETCDQGNGSITVVPSGGTAPFSYTWSIANPDSPTATALSAGTYGVTVTDANSCTGELSLEVINTPAPSLSVINAQNSFCTDGTGSIEVEALGGTAPYEYSIDGSTFQSSALFEDLIADTYTVTVQDANGCTETTSATLELVAGPSVSLLETEAACSLNDGEILVSVSGGTGPFSYAWSHDGGLTGNEASGLSPGDYTVTVLDANSCEVIETATITEIEAPTVSLVSTTDATCGNANGGATVSVSQGTPPYTYSWSVTNPSTASVTNLPGGSHGVTVVDARNCIAVLPITITDIAGPTSADLAATNTVCTEGNGAVTATPVGGTGPYTFAWSHDVSVTTATASNLNSGSYTVTVLDANGCEISNSIMVELETGPSIDAITANNSLCENGNGTISVNASGGQAPLTYTWDNNIGQADSSISDLDVGTYTVTVEDANGCTQIASASIALEPAPSAFVGQFSSEFCDQQNGSIDVSLVGGTGTAPFSYVWSHDSGLNAASVSGLEAGLYTVTIIDANGCEDIVSHNIENVEGPTLELASSSPDICGQEVGGATVNPVGGTGPYSYAWSADPGLNAPTITGFSSGSYTVTLTDANNCSTTLAINIEEIEGPVLSFGSVSEDPCVDADAIATVQTNGGTGNLTYAWSHNAGLSGPVATNLTTGTYTVSVTDENGCTDDIVIDVVEVGPPSLQLASVTDNECGFDNGAISVTASGGTIPYSYAWSDNTLPDSPDVTGLADGDYEVTLTDANGCTTMISATVAEFGGPILNVDNVIDAACNDNEGSISIAVSDGVTPYTYAWSHNAGLNAATATGLASGDYTVSVTDAVGCVRTIDTTVGTLDALTLSVTDVQASLCTNGNGSIAVSPSGGLEPYEISWDYDAAQTDYTITDLQAGTYTAILTDANGCTTSISETVEWIEGPTVVVIQQQNPGCNTNNGFLDVFAYEGTPPYSVEWSHDLLEEDLFIADLGPGEYTVSITDALGCTNSVTATLEAPTDITLETSFTQDENCNMADGVATVSVNGGPGPFTYQWSHDPGLDSDTATGLTAGTYDVTVSGTGYCEATTTVPITAVDGPTIGTPSISNSDCNASNGEISFTVSGGTGPYTFAWSHDPDLNDSVATGLGAGTYSIFVTDANGCTATNVATVSDEEAPSALIIQSNDPTCLDNDGLIEVSVTGGVSPYTYNWSHDSALNAPMAAGLSSGDYSVTVSDINGCISTVFQTLETTNTLLALEVSQNNSICEDGNGSLEVAGSGGTEPYSVAWAHDTVLSDFSLSNLPAGNYEATITDAVGCTATVASTISLEGGPELSLQQQSDAICIDNGSLMVAVTDGTAPYTYAWSHNPLLNSNTANGLAIGTYEVIVTDANNCADTLSATVEGAAPPELSTTSQDALCTNDNGSITVFTDNANGPYTYAWSHDSNLTTNSATGLTSGNYTITATDASGCSETISQAIAFNEGPTVSVSAQTNSLCTDGTGSIALSVVGGQQPYSVNWAHDPNLNQLSIDNLNAGDYEATIMDVNGCTDMVSTTIALETGPELSWAIENNASCDTDDGVLSVAVNNGLPPYTYAWSHDPGLTTATAENLAPGDYSVAVVDANGCTALLTSTIQVSELELSFSNIVDPLCSESENGSLTAAGNGGSMPYTFIWSNGEIGETIAGLEAGTYSVTMVDSDGCEISESIELIAADDLSLSFTSANTACNGAADGQAEVFASGGSGSYSYLWNAPGSPTTAYVDNLAAGDYEVMVMDDAGCSTIGMITISEPEAISLSTGSTASCLNALNGSASVAASGGSGNYTYQWDDPEGQTTATATDLAPGFYTVIVMDENACTETTNAIVEAAPSVDLNVIDITQPDCAANATGSATVEASGGTGGFTFIWNDSATQTGATASDLTPGTYEVTATDANGCTATLSVEIEAPGDLSITVSSIQSPDCFGETTGSASVSISNGSGNYQFEWNDPMNQSTANLADVAAGTYQVVVTDLADGCFAIQEVTIPEQEQLSLILDTVTSPTCNGENDGTALVAAQGGTGNYNYAWNDSAAQTGAFATNLAPGDYEVTATDQNGCETTLMVTVPETTGISANIDSFNAPTCFGENDGSATLIATGGTGNLSYQWNDPAFQQTATAIGLSPGDYTVQITDENGCETSLAVTIPETPELIISLVAIQNPSCSGFTDGSLSINISGGTGAYDIVWDDPNTQSGTTASDLASGDYTVIVTDENGCESAQTFSLEDTEALEVSFSTQSPVCFDTEDGSITAIITGGTEPYNYQWDDPDAQTTATASNLATGIYSILITDENGCSLTETVELTSDATAIVLTETQSDPSCEGGNDGALSVEATGGAGNLSFAWNNGENTGDLSNLIAGTYIVSVTDEVGCTQTGTYELLEGTPFVIELGRADTSLCEGEILFFDFSDTDYTLNWASDQGFSSTDDIVLLEEAATYTLTATNEAGCQDDDSITLNITDAPAQALFVTPTDVVAGEEVVVVEVSWPKPDAVEFFYNADSVEYNGNRENQYFFSFPTVGKVELTMQALFGGCEDWLTKTITVHADSTTIPSPFDATQEILKFSLSPNPNFGDFDVLVELSEEKPIVLSVFSQDGTEIDRKILQGQSTYTQPYTLAVGPGIYILALQTPTQRKSILFTVVSP